MMQTSNAIAERGANIMNAANTMPQGQLQALQSSQEAQLKIVQNREKMLDILLKQYDTQHKAISQEFESVQKVIDDNIKRSFKYGAQG
ncbi:MAG: hypothetical protein MZU97_01900 [Bacillus subtilis]|nr:hypothetical protein [Bacillus subtilis]